MVKEGVIKEGVKEGVRKSVQSWPPFGTSDWTLHRLTAPGPMKSNHSSIYITSVGLTLLAQL